ncbi:glycosyltransferase [Neobacillus sp.]|uniref:glycosyltransferase n=1 Tax=Neobacillus sp. TaxID=2675273 RepID=UPI00289654BE|nr:glycosyltransferase [Neobacillus sp.]
MDILFIGGVFPDYERDIYIKKSKGPIQFAANTLQWNIIRGLDQTNNKPVSILNSIFVGSYPRYYEDYYIKTIKWNHVAGADDINVGFLNIFGIKHLWKSASIKKQAIRWALKQKKERKAIIVYSMHTPFIYAAAMAKRANPEIKICLVVPDLPHFMDLSSKKKAYIDFLKKIDQATMNFFLKYVDCFVLLTQQMANAINIGEKPWIVMEGAIDPNECEVREVQDKINAKEKVIFYSGTLNRKYGIVDLLNAFSKIEDPNYRLWICGAGEAAIDIKNLQKRDSRIKYFGQVDRSEVLELQRSSTILINPRGNTEEFTKYSFPSKIMEYLLSGTPTIVKRLPGMPEEYFKYLFTVEGDTVDNLARKIIEVCEMPSEDLFNFGIKAQEFVLKEKNKNKQTERIIKLISNTY